MIKFNQSDDNKQFISILVLDKTPTQKVYDYINNFYNSINISFYKMDNEEILLNLRNDIKYGFSLNKLRKSISKIADATVKHFCVDLAQPSQRYNG